MIASSKNPIHPFHDIVTPRVAHEFQVGSNSTLRVGYAYRPGVTDAPDTGPGNYVDPSKHIFNLGVGFAFRHFMGKEVATRLDFNASYHQLVEQKVTKTQANEIGAPGYTVGGKIYGGGISLSLEL